MTYIDGTCDERGQLLIRAPGHQVDGGRRARRLQLDVAVLKVVRIHLKCTQGRFNITCVSERGAVEVAAGKATGNRIKQTEQQASYRNRVRSDRNGGEWRR